LQRKKFIFARNLEKKKVHICKEFRKEKKFIFARNPEEKEAGSISSI